MFEQELYNLYAFFKTNPIVAVVVGIFVALCFYAKPKESFKFLAFTLFLVAAFYVMTLMVGTVGSGSSQKDKMIHRTEEALRD